MCTHTISEDDWKSLARSKLRGFEEELHIAHEAGQTTYSGLKAWTFINGVVYCMTVVTTIGIYTYIVSQLSVNFCKLFLLWLRFPNWISTFYILQIKLHFDKIDGVFSSQFIEKLLL